MVSHTHLKPGLIDDDILNRIFSSDQSIYPAPLTLDRLRSWMRKCSPSSAYYDQTVDPPVLVGVIIVLPLRKKSWMDLLYGSLQESDISPLSDFSSITYGAEVGLHIFHVEKYSHEERHKGFTSMAMRDAEGMIESLNMRLDTEEDVKILGWSALTATEDGRGAFKNLGFRPTGPEEVFVLDESSGNVRMVHGTVEEGKTGKVVARAQMMVRSGPFT
jgi:hypothetical protein